MPEYKFDWTEIWDEVSDIIISIIVVWLCALAVSGAIYLAWNKPVWALGLGVLSVLANGLFRWLDITSDGDFG